ncbi:hypothetical protein JYU13_00455 [Gammaproteobacteria bacterium AH-315-M22]|nr:hypothetical protein [Gammaproteobacteria bacterium AH-315-M22]
MLAILNTGIQAALLVITLSYPFVVYWGLNNYGPTALAVVLFLLLLVRFLFFRRQGKAQGVLLVFFAIFCAAVIGFDSENLLRYYPVFMSLAVAIVFALSLTSEMTVIERFARLSKRPPPRYAKIYLRNLTKIWSVLLVLNAFVAGYSACCMSLQSWTLYNGILSYVFFALFMVLELIYRQFYKRKYVGMELP